MAQITAKMVKELRERTDLPMMECKQALAECDGDFEAAVEWLRKKHKGKLADRSGRATGEGAVCVHLADGGKVGAIIALECETAPVAKNEKFLELGKAFARKVAEGAEASPDLAAIRSDTALETLFTETFGKLRENMNLAAARRVEGAYLTSYIHHDGKCGVLIALDATPTSDNIGPDLCMHATFARPLAIDRSGVPADAVEKARSEAAAIAIDEGKPAQIVEKIVEGKVSAFYAEKCLMEQLHARSDVYGKKKVGEVLKEAGVGAVLDMAYLKIGG
jgi:elongation factor Ts